MTTTRAALIIARHEYGVAVRRREFLLVTFGLPLLYLALFGMIALATVVTAGTISRQQAPPVVGFLDPSGVLPRAALLKTREGVSARLYASLEAGQKSVRDREARALIVVPKDFRQSGRVTVYSPRSSLFGERADTELYAGALRAALLHGKVDESTIRRVVEPLRVTQWQLDRRTAGFERFDPMRQITRLAVPYVFSLLLFFAIFLSSSYLMHSVVEEKESRVIEVLLSAVTHEELLAGKLLGLGAAGLTQLALWVGSGLLFLPILPYGILLPHITIAPGVVVTAALMFLLGFGFYAAAMAGIGSLGTSWRESQQMAGLAVMVAMIPILFFTLILELPDGGLSRFLSLFPPTAPVGMMLRVAAGGASGGEITLAAVLLALAAWGVLMLSARVFRLSLLMYGQRPTPAQIWRGLRRSA